MYDVKVSDEYLDTICDWLDAWVEKDDSWAIPQFLKEYGIGWSYFKQFLDISPKLQNTFEVVISMLHTRWLSYAMQKDEMPRHMQTILLRYLKVYDNHSYWVETEARKEIAQESQLNFINFESENYSDAKLQGLYKQIYDDNANKRRDRTET